VRIAPELGNPHLRDQFAGDPERFSRFSLSIGDLTLDYSKNRIIAKRCRCWSVWPKRRAWRRCATRCFRALR
jgi:hypothetical protein